MWGEDVSIQLRQGLRLCIRDDRCGVGVSALYLMLT